MQPRISIIIPCYNGEKYLRETLDCLQKQTIEDWECIIVNDGSTDGSLEIMKEYAAKDSRYKYIDKKNEGPSVARNTAIAASSGKYILPLDADDLIAPSYAEKAIEYLELHHDCKLVYCEAEFFGKKSGKWELEDYSYDTLLRQNLIFCSAIFRKCDFEATNGYNKNMRIGIEDWDFWLSLLTKDDNVFRIPETLFYYRQHGDSRTNISSKHYKELLNSIIKNHIDIYETQLHNVILYDTMERYYKFEIEKLITSKKYLLGHKIYCLSKMPMNIIKAIIR